MAHKIGIYYNNPTLQKFITGDKIAKIEENIMQQKLAQIKAEFVQTFGVEGNFTISAVTTSGGLSHRSRITYRISAADAKTTALLKTRPGWLKGFMR